MSEPEVFCEFAPVKVNGVARMLGEARLGISLTVPRVGEGRVFFYDPPANCETRDEGGRHQLYLDYPTMEVYFENTLDLVNIGLGKLGYFLRCLRYVLY